eukprot:1854662-Pleurochrysis_carterae.AAC.1
MTRSCPAYEGRWTRIEPRVRSRGWKLTRFCTENKVGGEGASQSDKQWRGPQRDRWALTREEARWP